MYNSSFSVKAGNILNFRLSYRCCNVAENVCDLPPGLAENAWYIRDNKLLCFMYQASSVSISCHYHHIARTLFFSFVTLIHACATFQVVLVDNFEETPSCRFDTMLFD